MNDATLSDRTKPAASAMHAVRLQVMWNRLISVVEEQAQTLVRTSFSTSVREAGDLSAGVFDIEGRMLAQAVTGTPGHINSMAASVKHFLEAFPAETMRDGDVFVTNDPWKGTGHLHDFTMVTPTFRKGRLVALFAATSHVVDVGGLGLSPDSRQIYHEGIYIPLMPLVQQGRMNDWLLQVIRQNVREPTQVEGDIYALVACNERGSLRLNAMMDEYGLDDLHELGQQIISQSRQGMAATLGVVEVAFRVGLQSHGELMEVLGYLVVVVEALVVVHLAVTVQIVQTYNLITATDVDASLAQFQTKRLEQACGDALPG